MGATATLPGEAIHAGRFGWVGALLGALSTLIFWIVVPDGVRSVPVTIAALAVCFVAAAVFALMDWERLPQPARLIPIFAGLGLTVVAVWNTGGTESIFGIFFAYCGLGIGYFASRAQLPWLLVLIVVAPLASLLYDHNSNAGQEIFNALLWAVLGVATAVLVFFARERVRGAHAQLEALALQDPLTGVGNRRAFEGAVEAEIGRSRRSGAPFAVLYLDLDGFKQVNDLLGHAAGDRVLRRVAASIDTALRVEDVVARYGGDEFAILLPGAGEAEAATASARVVAAVERIAPEPDVAGTLGAGVGIATFPRDGADLGMLMETADRALRGVKGGRAAARAVGAPAASAASALPEPFDSSALLAGAEETDTDAADRWAPRHMVLGIGLPALAVAAAWVLLPLVLDEAAVRWTILALTDIVAFAGALMARKATSGIERRGWTLVALASALVLVPLLSVPTSVSLGFGVLLVAGCFPWRDRLMRVDFLLMLVCGLGVVLVSVLPELTDRFSDRPVLFGGALAGCLVVSIAIACALLVLPRTDPRTRPDAWLLGLAFLVAALDSIPLQLARTGISPLPGGWWAFGLPIAALMAGYAGALRARQPQRTSVPLRANHMAGSIVPTLVGIGLAVSVLFVGMPERVAAAACIVAIATLRWVRGREVEREAQRLAVLAERHQAARVAQSRASLTALSAALEARDGYTGHHGEQTVGLVRAVGQRLGLNPVEAAEVESAALLHDIGKIGIPDSILHKPGPLDEQEWEIMRTHPIIGERIVRAVPGMEPVAEAVRHEHEAWDGAGYPDGLSGESIPLASRIVLVCDAYHAMTSDRPYRSAMPVEAAREELRRCAGEQFDPSVVSALLAVLTTPPRTAPAARNGRPPEVSVPAADAPPLDRHTSPAALR